MGKYTFPQKGCGIGRNGKKITYAEAWKGFERSMTSSRIPCTSIERYPVVARWRADVDYVAAGIYCFQPYCVTGELDPPANPLICPQFCVRFNDLDNIGITGRHYSGFIMLGIQVFNYPNKQVFFKDECVEFNYRWLTEELGIDPEEITFIEDVWAGGGNLGPSIEYFVNGLELGNMVFMQYKTFHDGSREELPIKIIDTGIGLERIAWLINGSATSYMDTFKNALSYITKKLDININNEIWEKFGPYSCQLNIDEVENIDKTWEQISKEINVDVQAVKEAIAPVKDLYIILDHTRTVFMIIYDGSLPSNVGGGSNVRNILRRVFAILNKHGWFSKLGVDGIMELFEHHILDLQDIFGDFKKHENIRDVIQLEYEKWLSTDKEQKEKLEKLVKKKGGLTIDDWIIGMQSWGIPADRICELTGIQIPGNLYYEISQRAERTVMATVPILYDTNHLKETDSIYFADPHQEEFSGQIVDVFINVEKGINSNQPNIVILDQSAFYPNSGGQANDIGWLYIDGEEYRVLNAEKVGKCVLHILDRPLPGSPKSHIGKHVKGRVDMERRLQLMSHHTGTHIVFAAARKILGPHVWQNGAKKTEEMAHLDITHYKGLTFEEECAIEKEANRIVMAGIHIKKYFMDKAEAEKNFGFSLYQGGVVPGNNLRIVQIENTDVEACCGTHHDNTSEVGLIKMIKSQRISDGIVRLYYVAYIKALKEINNESQIINSLCDEWGVEKTKILQTAHRFFTDFKKNTTKIKKLDEKLLDYQMKFLISSNDIGVGYNISDHENPSVYFSFLKNYAAALSKNKKGVIFYNEDFIYGLIGDSSLLIEADFKKFLESQKKEGVEIKYKSQNSISLDKKTKLEKVLQFDIISKFNVNALTEYFNSLKFVKI